MNTHWSNHQQPTGQPSYTAPATGPNGRPNPHAHTPAWQTAPQPPRPSRNRRVLVAIGAVLGVFFLIGVIADLADGTTTTARSVAPSAAPAPSLTPVTPAPAPAPIPPSLVEQTQAAQTQAGPVSHMAADGLYVVGEDIEPGTYVTTGARPGLFELCSASTHDGQASNSGVIDWVTANANERIVVEIGPEVGSFETHGCEPWVRKQ